MATRKKGKAAEAAATPEAAEAVEANESKAVKRSKAEQLRIYKERYEPYTTATGVSMDNGDEVALVLRGASPEAVMAAAEKLKGLDKGELVARYADRNNGAKRMNAGNIIRGTVRRGEKTEKDVIAAIKAASKELNTVA